MFYSQTSADELVSQAVHGQDELRILRFGLQFLPQTHNVGVYRTRSGKAIIAPHLFEQSAATDGFSGMRKKELERFKFFRGELQWLTLARHLTAAQIYFHIAELILLLILRGCLRASQHCFDTSQQFADGKGLGHVVVGAKFEPDYLIDFLAARCEHDYWN